MHKADDGIGTDSRTFLGVDVVVVSLSVYGYQLSINATTASSGVGIRQQILKAR